MGGSVLWNRGEQTGLLKTTGYGFAYIKGAVRAS